jgi:hypothetical protein
MYQIVTIIRSFTIYLLISYKEIKEDSSAG